MVTFYISSDPTLAESAISFHAISIHILQPFRSATHLFTSLDSWLHYTTLVPLLDVGIQVPREGPTWLGMRSTTDNRHAEVFHFQVLESWIYDYWMLKWWNGALWPSQACTCWILTQPHTPKKNQWNSMHTCKACNPKPQKLTISIVDLSTHQHALNRWCTYTTQLGKLPSCESIRSWHSFGVARPGHKLVVLWLRWSHSFDKMTTIYLHLLTRFWPWMPQSGNIRKTRLWENAIIFDSKSVQNLSEWNQLKPLLASVDLLSP